MRFAPILFFVLMVTTLPLAVGQYAHRSTPAVRTHSNIAIDGKLTEPSWDSCLAASNFTIYTPNPGAPSSQRTDVRILYDNNFVYIGALMHDTHADSILHQLTSRDDYEYANTDAFTVVFDTYNDHQNGFAFAVTAAGVQADAKVRFDGYDYSWNAAWYSKAVRHDSGWTVEMKIPYSALRFPPTGVQLWGTNFLRTIRRIREKSSWNIIKPDVTNALGQAGVLNGIKDIKSPVRLALLPYLSAYAEDYDHSRSQTLNGGLDIKYGLNESFTLDMTLVPDFGQTLYDNKVLNLSPVEVRYDERRYFFTEGVDLFNKNDLFYSRRVGGTPVNLGTAFRSCGPNEIVEKNPATSRLYNATKVSGRNSNNLGIGFFNALSEATYATLRDTISGKERQIQTAPLTNYNVLVLDQALRNNSYITFVNTNVWRKENSYNANVSALITHFATKSNSYALDASADRSERTIPGQDKAGYRYFVQLAKIKGNYTAGINANTITDRFNPNDLGYLTRNNISYYSAYQRYNIYQPFSIFNNFNNTLAVNYNRVYHPNVFQSLTFSANHNFTLRSFHTAGIFYDVTPVTTNDYFEPRTPGRFYLLPSSYDAGAFISTDYRKKFAFDCEYNITKYNIARRHSAFYSFSPRYRFSDKLLVVLSGQANNQFGDVGFVDNVHGDIYLGTRNLCTTTSTLTAKYIFNNKMALTINGRHYWSKATYSKYSLLSQDGHLLETTYNTDHNINFNTFDIFTGFVWQFRPGSEMSVVYKNSIVSAGSYIYQSYFDNINNTLQAPQSNSISIKVIYYLDYQSFRKGMF
ncbi:MAG: hypothetical protein EBZ77_06180 [Chitinophagia bacterium]|nr:hypothetical protein [Chitinophagia bacterium]